MCIPDGTRLFLRSDNHLLVNGKLPAIKTSPASHMNYFGDPSSYVDSGFLSLFEYVPQQTHFPDGRTGVQSAWHAVTALNAVYVHFFFLPTTVNEVALNEDNVTHVPQSGRTPQLFNTSQCSPPARRSAEDGRVIEYANRYIDEYLYSGQWVEGMRVITVKRDNGLVGLLRARSPVSEVIGVCNKHWPCNGGDGGGDGGAGAGDGNTAMAC